MSSPGTASPTDLPARAWPATLKRTLTEFKEDKLNHWAAALTYYAVLSLFPALLVMVSLVGLVADPASVTKFLTDVISSLGPKSAVDTFKEPIESVTSSRGSAGVMAIVGVVAALWSASGYVGAFAEASNSIYEVEEGRPFWKLKPLQLLVTFVCIALVAVTALALLVSGPLATAVGGALGLSDVAVTAWQIGKWPVMLLLVLLILHVLYFASPNARVGAKWVSGGTLLTLVVWIVASVAFAFYVANFGSYNKT
jgi:membrane protein